MMLTVDIFCNSELQIRCLKWFSIDSTCVISSPNPMFDHLLESSRWDDSNKWSNIGFGGEMGILEIKIRTLSGALVTFFFLNWFMYCDHSLESSRRDDSYEWTQHNIWLRFKQISREKLALCIIVCSLFHTKCTHMDIIRISVCQTRPPSSGVIFQHSLLVFSVYAYSGQNHLLKIQMNIY